MKIGTHAVRSMVYVSNPKATDWITIFGCNPNSLSFFVPRNLRGIVDLDDCTVGVRIDICEPGRRALGSGNKVNIAVHLVIVYVGKMVMRDDGLPRKSSTALTMAIEIPAIEKCRACILFDKVVGCSPRRDR